MQKEATETVSFTNISVNVFPRENPRIPFPSLPCHRWQAGAVDPSSLAPTQVCWLEQPFEEHPFAGTDYSRPGVVLRPTAGAAPSWFCSFLVIAETTHPPACPVCTAIPGVRPETQPCFLRSPNDSVRSINPHKNESFSRMGSLSWNQEPWPFF